MKKIFNINFVVCLTLLSLVGWLAWYATESVQDRREADKRLDSVVMLLQSQRQSDAEARAALIESQRIATADLAALQQWQHRLIKWLSEQGIKPPAHLLRPVVIQSGGSGPKAGGSRAGQNPSAPSSTNDGPGKGKKGKGKGKGPNKKVGKRK